MFLNTAIIRYNSLSLHDALPISISVVGGAMFYLVLLPLLMQVYRRQVQDEMLRQHAARLQEQVEHRTQQDRKSTRLNSSHQIISYAVFCLKKKRTRVQRHGRDVC